MVQSEPPLTPVSDAIRPDRQAVEPRQRMLRQVVAELPALLREQELAGDDRRR